MTLDMTVAHVFLNYRGYEVKQKFQIKNKGFLISKVPAGQLRTSQNAVSTFFGAKKTINYYLFHYHFTFLPVSKLVRQLREPGFPKTISTTINYSEKFKTTLKVCGAVETGGYRTRSPGNTASNAQY